MMKSTDYANLNALIAIAETGSFRAAADRLGLKPSTLSHSIAALERRLGVPLLYRTTRAVSLTEAGQALYRQTAPSFDAIHQAVEHLNDFRRHPAGTVRLTAPRIIAEHLLSPKFKTFAEQYPDIRLEISSDNNFVDIVKAGFDAGIRSKDSIDKDMVAIRLTPDLCDAVVASPDYVRRNGKPNTPNDLAKHNCIGYRQGGGGLYRWEFFDGGRLVNLAVDGTLVLDDLNLMIQAALDGVGIAYIPDIYCQEHLASGRLVHLLADWCLPYSGFYLYYPTRNTSAALKALTAAIRAEEP